MIIKTCKTHGETEHYQCSKKYPNQLKCKRCNTLSVSLSRKNQKKKLVELFGSKCMICEYIGSPSVYDFHHVDPTKKEFGIGESGNIKSMKKLIEEAEKCVMICCRCHQEVHAGLAKCPELKQKNPLTNQQVYSTSVKHTTGC